MNQLFHANGQTDMKLIVAFSNVANAPKMAAWRQYVR